MYASKMLDNLNCKIHYLHVAKGTLIIDIFKLWLAFWFTQNAKIQFKFSFFACIIPELVCSYLRLAKDFTARLLWYRGSNFNSQRTENFSPLHRAVLNANCDLVQLLLQSGAGVASLDHNGRTPLHLACKINCTDIIKLLIDNSTADDLNIVCNDGNTPLLIACKNGFPYTIFHLLSKGANPNTEDKYGNTALHYVVLNKWYSEETVKQLLEAGADVNRKNGRCVTPLFKILYNYPIHDEEFRATILKICILLIEQSDLSIKNELGQSPLHIAVRKSDSIVVQKLILYGCDVDAADIKGYVPLYYACLCARGCLVKLLIENGANVHVLNQYRVPGYGCYSESYFLYKCVQEISKNSQSLSSCCQRVIRKYLRNRNLSSLPLPVILKQYI